MPFELIGRDISRETSIILLVKKLRVRGVQHLTMDLMGAQGLINRTIEEGLTIICPSYRSDSLHTEVDIATCGKVSDF